MILDPVELMELRMEKEIDKITPEGLYPCANECGEMFKPEEGICVSPLGDGPLVCSFTCAGYPERDPCPLCNRPLGTRIDKHHLKPKTFGGRDTFLIHKICHSKIHSVFSERELDKYYHTVERLLENEHIQNFVKWVSKKDPEFYEKTKDTQTRKRKRRR